MWGGGQEEHMIATGKTGINMAAYGSVNNICVVEEAGMFTY